MSVSHDPYGFRLSYTLPLPKKDNIYKRNTVDNYRAISISLVISKVFEHCVLTKFSKFFDTSLSPLPVDSLCGPSVVSVE